MKKKAQESEEKENLPFPCDELEKDILIDWALEKEGVKVENE